MRLVVIALYLIALNLLWAQPIDAANCTRVFGFSQTNQWYTGGFENYVPSSQWELQYAGGAGIDHFVDPNDPVWSAVVISPCTGSIDKAVLNVSGETSSDVSAWASSMQAAMANIRAKYPSVSTIALQPVVGGPGYGLCSFNGTTVRASFNAPYIAQAVDSLVGPGVTAGAKPTVNSCSDYADDIGHLQNSAFDSVAQQIAGFYNQTVPTPTPVTPVPTATPNPSSTVVNFNDLPSPNRPLTGSYPAGLITWGANWYLSGPWLAMNTNSTGFTSEQVKSASFTFSSPRQVLEFDALSGQGTSTVTLTCGSTITRSVGTGPVTHIVTGLSGACTTVTMTSSNGWHTNFDNLLIGAGSAQSPTPTGTPTVTPTSTLVPTNTMTPTAVATNTTVPTVEPCRVKISRNGGPEEWLAKPASFCE